MPILLPFPVKWQLPCSRVRICVSSSVYISSVQSFSHSCVFFMNQKDQQLGDF